MKENLATVLETVSDELGDRPALVHGDRIRSWYDFDDRAARLAGFLDGRGVRAGDRVAISLFNGIEYVESLFAILKLRAVPVNVNYRYKETELRHVFQDAGVRAMVLDPMLAHRVAATAHGMHTFVQLSTVDNPLAATAYAEAVSGPPLPRRVRGDDEWLLYTGGTTGQPKGVLARHSWVFRVCEQSGYTVRGLPVPQTLTELVTVTRRIRDGDDRLVCLPFAPLMHGSGIYNTLATLFGAGTVVYMAGRSYDPVEAATLLDRHRVTDIGLVGDVFARPLADELDAAAAAGRPYDLSHLRRLRSVGLTFSAEVKERLLAHGDFACYDSIVASEGGPFALAVTRRGDPVTTARFTLAPRARLIGDDGRDVAPGSGQVGVLAAPTDDHIHYLGNEAASARTFRVIDGQRYVVPGDLASLEADGALVFKGRGSGIINTGGEKVFAEEVEQVICRHPAIRDAMVVGVPDERWGHRIVAVVAADEGVTTDEVRSFVGRHLADHKQPRRVVVLPELRRSPAGKADLEWAREVAAAAE
ncbi:acyl-CoA synthetase [Virgisporangium ochraceum]|uniref:Fatty-acyl-CoA synthase n=1 Tax=Virgisporangium ochraceum TaxID=65505 RepID=A0A8J4A428_9ACTN|nr:AMP-binding protein [Virgisporangium ochraceum]GIJ74493.1 fatty-acyl-CoA synthase [Virgisporangium ochraceum]